MTITITCIILKNPWHFFRLSWLAGKSLKQFRNTSDGGDFKSTGFWKTHYTMSSWEDPSAMKKYAHKKYARDGAHFEAIKSSRFIAREIRTITYDDHTLPSWKEAKKKVSNGKALYF